MKGLFIIVIVLVVLWFINQHTKKYEPFETNEEESEKKVELSLCDLVALIKKLLINGKSDIRHLSHEIEPRVKQVRYELEPRVEQVRHDLEPVRHDLEPVRHDLEPVRQDLEPVRQDLEPVRQDLEYVMPVENMNMNMNIINNVEPNDDDVYSNQSLFAQIE